MVPTQSVVPLKRKPGRPKGSTKRRRVETPVSSTSPQGVVETGPSATRLFSVLSASLPRPATWQSMSDADQQLYDFQWKVLTLCREFYETASELLVSALFYTSCMLIRFMFQRTTPQDVVSRTFGLQDPSNRPPLDVLTPPCSRFS